MVDSHSVLETFSILETEPVLETHPGPFVFETRSVLNLQET